MKHFLFAIIVGIFLTSCNDQNKSKTEVTSFVEWVDTSKGISYVDSLDLDTLALITDNFPDTVHKVLHKSIDTLERYVDSSFTQAANSQKNFSKTKLNELLVKSGFSVDTTEIGKFAKKKDFNKRYVVNWLNSKSDTITTQVQYWYQGRTYLLIHMRWNLLD